MPATRNPFRLVLVALALATTGCGKWADDLFCAPGGCGFSDAEWARLASLANPGDPPPDLSERISRRSVSRRAGQAILFRPRLLGQRPPERRHPAGVAGRARAEGAADRDRHARPVTISAHGGADTSSSPGHVSVGAGWTDVNALSVLNSAYRLVVFWNGRADSLWALNVLVAESPTTMNGNRLNTAHVIVDSAMRGSTSGFSGSDRSTPPSSQRCRRTASRAA